MISIMRAGPQAERWLKVHGHKNGGCLRAWMVGRWLVVRDLRRFIESFGEPEGLLG
jgi:hypothetical protein